ncbi:MAG: DUF1800 family protein, partial [Acidobacteria bacterium]|nr:DUF1800 family protein [Acidobacteriota bacterium]
MGRYIGRYAAVAVALGLMATAILLWVVSSDRVPDRQEASGASTEAVCQVSPGIAIADSADERLLRHVLDRTGYGPRPGDIERLRQVGVEAYLEQQLSADGADAALEERLATFETQQMSRP